MPVTGICDVCRRMQELGILCNPLSCSCNCHAKTRQAIYAANFRKGFNARTISQRIKAGEGYRF